MSKSQAPNENIEALRARSISVRVDVIAGSSIQQAADEICALADKLGVMVSARFNSRAILANPDKTTPSEIVERYLAAAGDSIARTRT